jgi:hypothetical protein
MADLVKGQRKSGSNISASRLRRSPITRPHGGLRLFPGSRINQSSSLLSLVPTLFRPSLGFHKLHEAYGCHRQIPSTSYLLSRSPKHRSQLPRNDDTYIALYSFQVASFLRDDLCSCRWSRAYTAKIIRARYKICDWALGNATCPQVPWASRRFSFGRGDAHQVLPFPAIIGGY